MGYATVCDASNLYLSAGSRPSFSTCNPAKQDDSAAWAVATHVGDPNGVPGAWLQHDPALAVVALWGSERAVGRSVCVCFSFPLSVTWPFKSIQIFVKIAKNPISLAVNVSNDSLACPTLYELAVSLPNSHAEMIPARVMVLGEA